MTPGRDPPSRADRLLAWVLPPGDRGLSIVGDLHREFGEIFARRGPTWARVWYWREAVALAVHYGRAGMRADEFGGGEPVATLMADLRYGMRMLVKTPLLSMVAVLTIALGVGLTTHTYSSLDGTVLRGVPVPDNDRLVLIDERIPRLNIEQNSTPLHDFLDLQEQQTVFEGVAAYSWGIFNLAGDAAPPERVDGARVSANALALIGVPPLLGRIFRPGEDAPDAPPSIVLSYALWKNRFDSDPDILGRTIRVNGETTEVVGVMPEGFAFPFMQAAWMPYHYDPATTARRAAHLDVFARTKPGISREAVKAELARISSDIEAVYPEENEDVHLWSAPFSERYMPRQITAVMFLMLAATFGVLLIACANVANLLLARTAVRGREVAIRTALGASRLRVIRQLMAEALALALVGGVLGVAIAWVGVDAFAASIVDIQKPYWIDIRMDGPALVFGILVTLLATVAAGTVPALRASGEKVGDTLRDEARSASRRLGRLTSVLVVGEITVSCGLLIASGVMIRSIVNLRNVHLGFDPTPVVMGTVVLPGADYATRGERTTFFRTLQERLEAESGVRTAALATNLPALGASTWWIRIDGETYPTQRDVPQTNASIVTTGFFETMNIPFVQGRDFESADVWDSTDPVAVVNESFVRRYLPRRDAIGARVHIGLDADAGPWVRIVGVVPDVHVGGGVGGLGDDLRPPQYLWVTPATFDVNGVDMVARVDGDPAAFAGRMRSIVTELDGDLPVANLQTMPEAIERSTWAFGLFGSLFTIFGFAALFLAAVGLYGVMAFSVAQRRQEIGVRMALGAAGGTILRMVLREGTGRLTLGIALGLVLGYVLAKPMSVVTYGVKLTDPFLFLFILATLGSAGLLACVLPARSATRADPVEAMRPR